MHMDTGELKTHKHDAITLLEAVSMEGRYYMARFQIGDQWYVLTDPYDEPVLFSGASAVREYFHDYDVSHMDVIPPTGTDEMIGMPSTGDETMRVPL